MDLKDGRGRGEVNHQNIYPWIRNLISLDVRIRIRNNDFKAIFHEFEKQKNANRFREQIMEEELKVNQLEGKIVNIFKKKQINKLRKYEFWLCWMFVFKLTQVYVSKETSNRTKNHFKHDFIKQKKIDLLTFLWALT